MNNFIANPNNNFNTIQESLKFEFMNRFRTGNPLLDALISIFIFSNLLVLINQFYSSYNQFGLYFYKIFRYFRYLIPIWSQNTIIDKVIVIDYLTDTKQINELYKAVHWYLGNNQYVNYIVESPLNLSYEKSLSGIKLDDLEPNLNKIIVNNKWTKFVFKEKEIYYLLEKEIVTVYSDKERKRENYQIRLSTRIEQTAKVDPLEEFCQFCLKEYVKSLTTRKWIQQIYINDGKVWRNQPSKNKRRLETIILRKGMKEDIINDIDTFLKASEWYHDRDIPYTRGYLFHGPPGTGKTSMIKGLSNHCKRHLHYLNLNLVSDDNQLLELLQSINYQETILVIEDIDAMVDKIKKRKIFDSRSNREPFDSVSSREPFDSVSNREPFDSVSNNRGYYNLMPANNEMVNLVGGIQNVIGGMQTMMQNMNTRQSEQKKSELTLSGILNAIDGIFNNDGRILIITSNNPNDLDIALIRPGRVDRKFLFDNCDQQQMLDLYYNFFGKSQDLDLDLSQYKSYSPAHLTSKFLQYKNDPQKALLSLDEDDTI
jgi:hypothetical protein